MQDSKNLLNELLLKMQNNELVSDLITLKEMSNLANTEYMATRDALNDNLLIINRKNSQIESEIQQLMHIQTRNTEIYNKKNSERLKLAKKVIDLEQKNEEFELQINELEKSIISKEEEISRVNQPSKEMLFYEIVKGFGVEFQKKGQKTIVRIKNKAKKDVFSVEVDEGNLPETCDKVWSLL